MGTISKDTFKRVFLLYLIGKFKDGSYGKLRLEKIVYFIEREISLKPFEYKWYHMGQYSEELSDILEQLISTGHVTSLPLESGKGNKYVSTTNGNQHKIYESIINKIGGLKTKIGEIVDKWGYETDAKILNYAYSLQEVKGKKIKDVLLNENLPNKIELSDFDEDYCEDLELAFNPSFIASMEKILRAIEETPSFDISKVKKVGGFL